jgi:hypothetical protein
MNGQVNIAARCNWCSHWKPESDVHRLSTNQVICGYCLEWHLHALDVMGGNMPNGCQECGERFEHAPEIHVYVVQKDGIYQVLCSRCVTPYTRKRGDIYKGTQYGKSLNL